MRSSDKMRTSLTCVTDLGLNLIDACACWQDALSASVHLERIIFLPISSFVLAPAFKRTNKSSGWFRPHESFNTQSRRVVLCVVLCVLRVPQ